MKLVLDTHILLWWLSADRRLSRKARTLIENPRNAIFVSSATVWEIAIKQALGRIEISLPDLEDAMAEAGFQPLNITWHHAAAIAALANHHQDPFDRMLVAQCNVEMCRLLTHDSALAAYGKAVEVV